MGKVDLHFKLYGGASRVEMTTSVDGDTKIRTFWTETEIDSLIRVLTRVRRDMSSDVPFERPKTNTEGMIPDPKFSLRKSEDRVILSLRHPGLGWIDWAFSAHLLADVLSSMVATIKT